MVRQKGFESDSHAISEASHARVLREPESVAQTPQAPRRLHPGRLGGSWDPTRQLAPGPLGEGGLLQAGLGSNFCLVRGGSGLCAFRFLLKMPRLLFAAG